MTVIGTIAAWCAKPRDFTPAARRMAVDAITDTVGCMLAGAADRSTAAVRRALSGQLGEQGPSGVVGGGRAEPAVAALINGTAAHALDFDDNFHAATTHASAVLVPALLALGEQHADGERLVTAYLVGLEAQAAIGGGLNPSHYTAGWHSTATVGCIGAAAAAAWLLGLDEDGIAAAMSVAVSMAGGPKGQFGTPVKPFHAGLAARNAVEAAQLAAAGMTGNPGILEDAQGYLALAGGGNAKGWAGLTLGDTSVIETVGLATKRHPCCGSTHRAIDMLLDLRAEHGFAAADVREMEALVAIAHARNLAFAAPKDEMEARFSMNYCLAVALLNGRVTLADFTPQAVARPEVRRLLELTRMAAYSEAVEKAATGRLPHELTVTLRDGRVFRASKKFAKGTLADPLSESDRREKFLDCAARVIQPADARQLYSRLTRLDTERRLNFLDTIG